MGPKDSKLTEQDAGVCLRVREIRQLLGIDQKTLASSLDVTRDRIASYENLRAPIRYEFGDRFCSVLNVNQRWLACGKLPMLQYVKVYDGAVQPISNRALFSEAIESEPLKSYIRRHIYDLAMLGGCKPEEVDLHFISTADRKIGILGPGIVDHTSLLCPILVSRIKAVFDQVPPKERPRIFRALGRALNECLRDDA